MSEPLTLHLTHVYKQARKQVFEAWTNPQHLSQWFAPGALQVKSVEIDPREGGVFRVFWTGPALQDGTEMCAQLSGVYQKVIPGELLRFSWKLELDLDGDTLVTVEFRDVETGTEVSLTQERISSEQILHRNRGGWGGCLEKLAVWSDRAAVGGQLTSAL